MKRSLQEPTFEEFAQQIKGTQDAYVAAKKANDLDGMKRALFQLDETQVRRAGRGGEGRGGRHRASCGPC